MKLREDGWPLCPHCGEDELADLENDIAKADSERLFCYRCSLYTVRHGVPVNPPAVMRAWARYGINDPDHVAQAERAAQGFAAQSFAFDGKTVDDARRVLAGVIARGGTKLDELQELVEEAAMFERSLVGQAYVLRRTLRDIFDPVIYLAVAFFDGFRTRNPWSFVIVASYVAMCTVVFWFS